MEAIQKLKSSTTRIVKGSEIPHPREILDMFAKIGKLSHVKFNGAIQGTNGEDVEIINNYLVEVKIDSDELFGTVGIIVKQSSNKAIIYHGATASACMNLCIFNSEGTKEVKIDIDLIDSIADTYANNLVKRKPLILERIDELSQKVYTPEEWIHAKGKLLTVLPTNCLPNLLHAENLCRNKESLYKDWSDTNWKLLSMMTDCIKDESVTNRVKKTLLIENVF